MPPTTTLIMLRDGSCQNVLIHYLLTLMSFQNCRTYSLLQNTIYFEELLLSIKYKQIVSKKDH